MIRKKYSLYLFRILCCLLFTYQAGFCIYEYVNQDVASKTTFENQELHPRPLVCVTADRFEYQNFNNSANISHDEYKDGRWRTENLSEEELFNFLAPDIFDLINNMEIGKFLQKNGDNYTKIKFPVDRIRKHKENFVKQGIKIQRIDHYYNMKTYCFNFR